MRRPPRRIFPARASNAPNRRRGNDSFPGRLEEREKIDGELVEVSRNWYARCVETHDVFYFGEDVDIIENGQVVRHDGSWQAGKNGAQPGIIIPARFLLGSRYFQEQASPVAADRAEHVAMGLDVTAAGQTFHDCVAVTETSPLEPGHESAKTYFPGGRAGKGQ